MHRPGFSEEARWLGRERGHDARDVFTRDLDLPAKHFDSYAKRALREDVSVPEIIRRTLREREAEKEKKQL